MFNVFKPRYKSAVTQKLYAPISTFMRVTNELRPQKSAGKVRV